MTLIDPPHPSAPTRPASSRWVAVVNLLNSIVGAGILSLPYAFRECGYISGIVMQLAFGLITFYGIWLLLNSLEFAPGVRSSEDLADRALGRFGWYLYNVSTAVNCTGACLGYVIVIGDILVPLMAELGAPTRRPVLLVGVTTLVGCPPRTSRRCSTAGRRHAHLPAFAASMVMLMLSGPAALLEPPPAPFKADVGGLDTCGAALGVQSARSWPLFPHYQELREPTPARMGAVAAVVLTIAALVYAGRRRVCVRRLWRDAARRRAAEPGRHRLRRAALPRSGLRAVHLLHLPDDALRGAALARPALLPDRRRAEMPHPRGCCCGRPPSSDRRAGRAVAREAEVVLGWSGALAPTSLLHSARLHRPGKCEAPRLSMPPSSRSALSWACSRRGRRPSTRFGVR